MQKRPTKKLKNTIQNKRLFLFSWLSLIRTTNYRERNHKSKGTASKTKPARGSKHPGISGLLQLSSRERTHGVSLVPSIYATTTTTNHQRRKKEKLLQKPTQFWSLKRSQNLRTRAYGNEFHKTYKIGYMPNLHRHTKKKLAPKWGLRSQIGGVIGCGNRQRLVRWQGMWGSSTWCVHRHGDELHFPSFDKTRRARKRGKWCQIGVFQRELGEYGSFVRVPQQLERELRVYIARRRSWRGSDNERSEGSQCARRRRRRTTTRRRKEKGEHTTAFAFVLPTLPHCRGHPLLLTVPSTQSSSA